VESKLTGKLETSYSVNSRTLDSYGDPITGNVNPAFMGIYDPIGKCADTPILPGNVLSFS